jgi:hypothetical protein
VPPAEGNDNNPRVFDYIVDKMLTTDANFVIDAGSSSFVELYRYLLRNGIPQHAFHCLIREVAQRRALCCPDRESRGFKWPLRAVKGVLAEQ